MCDQYFTLSLDERMKKIFSKLCVIGILTCVSQLILNNKKVHNQFSSRYEFSSKSNDGILRDIMFQPPSEECPRNSKKLRLILNKSIKVTWTLSKDTDQVVTPRRYSSQNNEACLPEQFCYNFQISGQSANVRLKIGDKTIFTGKHSDPLSISLRFSVGKKCESTSNRIESTRANDCQIFVKIYVQASVLLSRVTVQVSKIVKRFNLVVRDIISHFHPSQRKNEDFELNANIGNNTVFSVDPHPSNVYRGKFIIRNSSDSSEGLTLAVTLKGEITETTHESSETGKSAIIRRGDLIIDLQTSATVFEVFGDSYIRTSEGLSFTVEGMHPEVGKSVILFDNPHNNFWGHAFSFNDDYSLCLVPMLPSVKYKNMERQELCIGTNNEYSNIILVDRKDDERIITFDGIVKKVVMEVKSKNQRILSFFPPQVDLGKYLLILKQPSLPGLGEGLNAISLLPTSNQEIEELVIMQANDAVEFNLDGSAIFSIRKTSNLLMVAHLEKVEEGSQITLFQQRDRLTVPLFFIHSDGTVRTLTHEYFCLGVKAIRSYVKVVLVNCNNENRIVLATSSEILDAGKIHRANSQKREDDIIALRADAKARCSLKMRTRFRNDGFYKFEKAISNDLIRAARMELNRELGSGEKPVAAYKAKTSSSQLPIVNLVKKSVIPYLLQELLGDEANHFVKAATHAQIILRFPGDLCPSEHSPMTTPEHFVRVRHNWHIDGFASNVSKDAEFFGEIHNFNALIGVVLKDIEKPMSGELGIYPGSHVALSKWFKRQSNLESVRDFGVTRFPHNETDKMFHEGVVHATADAGDVFLLNHMTAHFVCPNVSPEIRYAVYFRLSNADFNVGNLKAIHNPWHNWIL